MQIPEVMLHIWNFWCQRPKSNQGQRRGTELQHNASGGPETEPPYRRTNGTAKTTEPGTEPPRNQQEMYKRQDKLQDQHSNRTNKGVCGIPATHHGHDSGLQDIRMCRYEGRKSTISLYLRNVCHLQLFSLCSNVVLNLNLIISFSYRKSLQIIWHCIFIWLHINKKVIPKLAKICLWFKSSKFRDIIVKIKIG